MIKRQLYYFPCLFQVDVLSLLWRHHFIKDITALQKVQHSATKYILNDYNHSDYKARLQQLQLLPLMYIIYESSDLI